MKVTTGQILDVVRHYVLEDKAVSLDSRLDQEFKLDHLDMRDIVFYLEDELGLVNDALWEEETLVKSYPTLRALLDSYDNATYEIEDL